ncbi:hypothetical protein CW304_32850 [Bacillus sp. UFRGS-B20]|nr:hypothetical protein CW304_32850 [Bacillus sp. UFRGS-B20]
MALDMARWVPLKIQGLRYAWRTSSRLPRAGRVCEFEHFITWAGKACLTRRLRCNPPLYAAKRMPQPLAGQLAGRPGSIGTAMRVQQFLPAPRGEVRFWLWVDQWQAHRQFDECWQI